MDVTHLLTQLKLHGQEHLLRWWEELRSDQRRRLAEQIEAIDFGRVQQLWEKSRSPEPPPTLLDRAEPPSTIQLPQTHTDRQMWQEARRVGQETLRAGKVAVLVVAGGQGTRLGFDHPKGMYPIGPVTGKSLFQMLAEKVLATSRRYGVVVPYYVMTSHATHEETVSFFAEHNYFGLGPEDVRFFRQGWMPAVDAATGQVLLEEKDRIATSPNGHGGVLEALHGEGVLVDLKRRGIEEIFYHQVDNPLVKVCDPAFIGFHIRERAEVSIKVVAKEQPEEKLGVLVKVDDQVRMIEYSEVPPDVAAQQRPDGRLRFWAGSIAIHIFQVAFLDRLMSSGVELPYHCALKKVPFIDSDGRRIEPERLNAVKFERFIFDILPHVRRSLVVEASRAEEYGPVKNATGESSPDSARRSISRLYAHWLRQIGVERPSAKGTGTGALGDPPVPIEISPLLALDSEDLAGQVPADLHFSGPLYLGPRSG